MRMKQERFLQKLCKNEYHQKKENKESIMNYEDKKSNYNKF